MVGSVTLLNPVPVAVAHDPLGRAMTEDQKTRMREQPLPPVEETQARERIVERRREGAPGERHSAPRPSDDGDDGPGHLIDSYV
jgi:hypothetical protein